MGPTNVALVKLFKADLHLREAQQRLDDAERNVRIQDRRVNDLAEKSRLGHAALREQQTKARALELDIAARDQHIERLRTQQQVAKNNREYQAFLVEINTGKVDKAKVEEEAMRVMQAVETGQAEAVALQQHLDAEKAKLETMKAQIGESVAQLRTEVQALVPAREAASAAVPPRAREAFERLSEHHGEAMSAISKPDRRREEYLCTACNMELARDVYNKLHTRDEVVVCPSCRRILYIPEDLPPEHAVGTGKPVVKRTTTRTTTSKSKKAAVAGGDGSETGGSSTAVSRGEVEIELRAKGKLGTVLAKAQGETVRSANAAGETPVECEVYIGDTLAGIYKGQTPEKLLRAIKYYMQEASLFGEARVEPVAAEQEEPPAEAPTPPAVAAEAAAAAGDSAPEQAESQPAAADEPGPNGSIVSENDTAPPDSTAASGTPVAADTAEADAAPSGSTNQ